VSNLNSVLVEGVLEGDALFRETLKGVPICTFKIASVRHSRNEDTKAVETCISLLKIEAHGSLAETAKGKAVDGMGVRVVGHLVGDDESHLYIYAEHIEYRPDILYRPPKKSATIKKQRKGV